MTVITKTIIVTPAQVSLVEDKLNKLNKKAVKLGITPAVITSKREYIEVKKNLAGKVIDKKPLVEMVIEATEIKYGEYEFIATLDHTIGNKPIVKLVPNKVLPEVYQEADCNCDHCGIKRNRNNTYVFKDDNGYKQVGGSCLKEFFGIDPTNNIDWFKSIYDMDRDEFGGIGGRYHESVSQVIAYGLAVVEKNGYSSKKATQEYNEKVTNGNYIDSTSDLVFQALNPPLPNHDNRDQIEWCNSIRDRAIELYDEADKMIAWGIEYFAGQKGEYSHNMRIFLEAVSIEPKYFGYVVSVIGAWNRENVAKAEKEVKRFDNQFIGNIKDKITVNVIVNKIIQVSGNYGYSYINIMTQKETGNNLVWISSNNVLDEGSNVCLVGTVKTHIVRDGKNQTALTRCKVL